jgi:hypothetical protein
MEGTVSLTKEVGSGVSMIDTNCQSGGTRAGTRAKRGRSGVKLLSSSGIFSKSERVMIFRNGLGNGGVN